MDDMNEKIGAVLNDPKLMQQIMSMAQSLGGSAPEQTQQKQERQYENNPMPDIDMATIQRLSGLAQQSSIDKREQALLRALGAYLSKERIGKLEKAMRAAKMAKLASSALGQKGLLSLSGR